MVWGGRREEGSGWGTHVYLWRIHFDTWQNQYNIVKLKNKIKLKKKEPKKKKLKKKKKRMDNNKVWLYSTGNYIQYPVINHNGKEYEKEYIYVKLNHFALQQKLMQYYKSTILQ